MTGGRRQDMSVQFIHRDFNYNQYFIAAIFLNIRKFVTGTLYIQVQHGDKSESS